jgi:hypothetical protein
MLDHVLESVFLILLVAAFAVIAWFAGRAVVRLSQGPAARENR